MGMCWIAEAGCSKKHMHGWHAHILQAPARDHRGRRIFPNILFLLLLFWGQGVLDKAEHLRGSRERALHA
jgi:hypothetical protein